VSLKVRQPPGVVAILVLICGTYLALGDYGVEHFYTAALPALPLETAAGISNKF
jgi:hypothetical protein